MENLDNDRRFLRPKAWHKAKQAFGARAGSEGGSDVGRALLALERFARRSGWSVRIALAVAIGTFLSRNAREKKQALMAWFANNRRDRGPAAGPALPEQLPQAERDALKADFDQVVRKLFGPDTKSIE